LYCFIIIQVGTNPTCFPAFSRQTGNCTLREAMVREYIAATSHGILMIIEANGQMIVIAYSDPVPLHYVDSSTISGIVTSLATDGKTLYVSDVYPGIFLSNIDNPMIIKPDLERGFSSLLFRHNFPNPFNPCILIYHFVPDSQLVRLSKYSSS